MKIQSIIAIALLLTQGMAAQNTADIKKEINMVKRSNSYIYAEATAPTVEEAKAVAEEILYAEVNEWAATKRKFQTKGNFVVNNKSDLWTSYSLPRGNMFRSFIYVKKSDIISVDDSDVIGGLSKGVVKLNPSKATPSFPDAVLQVYHCTKYSELVETMTRLKNSGMITHYARYASLTKPEMYYLAIYDRRGTILSVLTNGTPRLNVETGKEDGVLNYKGCGAIGFLLSDSAE
ncbi:MAG: hypothetical protein Q4D64_10780 [Prevotellaceae bacterium]|nr:hypothetical protein [Prevotellaceae bacterium]